MSYRAKALPLPDPQAPARAYRAWRGIGAAQWPEHRDSDEPEPETHCSSAPLLPGVPASDVPVTPKSAHGPNPGLPVLREPGRRVPHPAEVGPPALGGRFHLNSECAYRHAISRLSQSGGGVARRKACFSKATASLPLPLP